MTDPRRQGRVIVEFEDESSRTGNISVDGVIWGAVEGSEKRGVWCIEDVEGKCLRHASSIHGQAAAKDEAIALAERMVRDGTLPTPEEAKRLRDEERELRAQRPSEIRRKQERAERSHLLDATFDADWANEKAAPFYEIFAEAFDLADPDLWKSNSFSMLRPRLIIEARAAIANLEYELHEERRIKRRFQRRSPAPELEYKLARAREILALLELDKFPSGDAA
jgi:hypothetical protein